MAERTGESMKGRILNDMSKRVLIVEGKDELDRIMRLQSSDKSVITNYKKLNKNIYEIEIIQKVGSFYPIQKEISNEDRNR